MRFYSILDLLLSWVRKTSWKKDALYQSWNFSADSQEHSNKWCYRESCYEIRKTRFHEEFACFSIDAILNDREFNLVNDCRDLTLFEYRDAAILVRNCSTFLKENFSEINWNRSVRNVNSIKKAKSMNSWINTKYIKLKKRTTQMRDSSYVSLLSRLIRLFRCSSSSSSFHWFVNIPFILCLGSD
jgi:hypothetical protein